jgi:DNA-directed RNA polymerase specialized sigma24 family protein
LAAIARNLVIDTLRSDKRFQKAMVEISDEMMTSEWDPPREWAEAADQAIVERYLCTLSPALAAVHHQRYVRCASQEDAARALSISRQQLRTLEKSLKSGLAIALATDTRGRR